MATIEERLWVIQCKRGKTPRPTRLRTEVEKRLRSLRTPTYGFIPAVACDVSKAGRDAVREEMVAHRMESFAMWAKLQT